MALSDHRGYAGRDVGRATVMSGGAEFPDPSIRQHRRAAISTIRFRPTLNNHNVAPAGASNSYQ